MGEASTAAENTPLREDVQDFYRERAKERQPAQRTIERLIRYGKFRRSPVNSSTCELERGEEKYAIERVTRKDSELISQAHKLFRGTFGEKEVDLEDVLRNNIEGKTPFGTKAEVKYMVYVAKDKNGKVVSVLTAGHLDLLDKNRQRSGDTVLIIGYVVTDKNVRLSGFASQLYVSALIDASIEAERQGKRLILAAGEAKYTSEKFWNSVGWKRVYAQVGGNKKEYKEAEYIQPALAFNIETGDPAESAGETPEHLMIDGFGRFDLTKEKIMRVVQAMYRWNNIWPIEAFKGNTVPYFKHRQHAQKLENKFDKFLMDYGRLIFLDYRSREKARRAEVTIHEHVVADFGQTGAEDF